MRGFGFPSVTTVWCGRDRHTWSKKGPLPRQHYGAASRRYARAARRLPCATRARCLTKYLCARRRVCTIVESRLRHRTKDLLFRVRTEGARNHGPTRLRNSHQAWKLRRDDTQSVRAGAGTPLPLGGPGVRPAGPAAAAQLEQRSARPQSPVPDVSEILARFPGFHHPAGPPES